MKYEDLFSFEPIESVIQLREADDHERAMHLVETFVISDRMADQLTNVVFPNLQFHEPADNKGVLVVGNYGTGKSHLMSLVSALAEHPDARGSVRSPQVAEAAGSVSGRFKVVRTEIGATEMTLRDIVLGQLTDGLREMGIDFVFPAVDQVSNNKDCLEEMMGEFTARFPDHGLLLVVDELLDFLHSRKDQNIVLDLNFLRELGEVCRSVRFRFVAGLQESLFDNPRFQFVADSLVRVRDRFQQLRIIREDVAFVVSERLLRKTPEQRARIREHLAQFAPLYDTMAERMEQYVSLFPVHPAYLDVFERLAVAEKREVLRTISTDMRKLIGTDVPEDEPGLVSYDSYWDHLRDNAALRAIPEVKEVLDKSVVLEDRIQQAFTRPAYRPMALRICRGLAVQRLATDDIYAPLGPTPDELRDGLCLHLAELPERTSDFLRTSVEACLREITRTMSGQYISHNADNGQYYLDLKKDIDYDAQIEKRAESLSSSDLDRYYFDALTRLMECADQTYVTGYRIWEHEVEWIEHKVTRRGYLFFGAPNQRSTAQPPRDFYIYFIQPGEPPTFKDEKLADEVFFVLKRPDDALTGALRLYGGARALGAEASAATRKVYEDKGNGHLRAMTDWLRNNMLQAFDVTHQGVTRKTVDVLKGHRTGNLAVRDTVNLVGSACLSVAFDERYPDYPVFSQTLTKDNLGQAAGDAIRFVAGGQSTQTAMAVLEGLELLDAGKLRPQLSPYGKAVLERLAAVEANQVLNRKDLMTAEHGVEWETVHRLEPELFAVVLLSLVYTGDIVLSLVGRKLDAANLSDARDVPLDELCRFRHIERPKDIPLPALVALFELLGLQEGLIRDPNSREEGIRKLHDCINGLVQQVVTTTQHLQGGFVWWGGALVTEEQQAEYRGQLEALKGFLERLQPINTPGKLRNFPFTIEQVQAQGPNLSRLRELQSLKALVDELSPVAAYLTTAEQLLTPDDPWCEQMRDAQSSWRTLMLDPVARSAQDFRHKVTQALNQVKSGYQERYAELHQRVRLGVGDDDRKKRLLADTRMQDLQRLAAIELLPHSSLTSLQSSIAGLRSCFEFTRASIDATPVCPHCSFRPAQEETGATASVVLGQMDEQLDALTEAWTRILVDNLADPTALQSIELLSPEQRRAVDDFAKTGRLPGRVGDDLIQGIQNALSGLEPIVVTTGSLLGALGEVAGPCTVEQFRSRFEDFVRRLTEGKDVGKVRIRIEQPDGREQ